MNKPFLAFATFTGLAIALVACVQATTPNPKPGPSGDPSIGAPFDGQIIAGTSEMGSLTSTLPPTY
jgi:hypothetical protein